jgi:antitoxin component of RelBE/YafQ-DinJ toxin-antitoxin module
MTMTFIGQQIALVKVPEAMRSRLGMKAEFWLRSGTNTFVNFLILILAWKAAAAAKGCHIDGAEIGTALGFCGMTYTGLQFFRDFAFLRLPKRMDQKYVAQLSSSSSVFEEIKKEASKKAQELGIDPLQTNELILTLLEKLIESLPFESRISDGSPLSKAIAMPKAASDRRLFIRNLLRLHRKSSEPALTSAIEDVLDLGPPFSKNESLRFHKIFSERHAKRAHLKIGAAAIDRLLGGVLAGGLLMRQLTQNVLRQ